MKKRVGQQFRRRENRNGTLVLFVCFLSATCCFHLFCVTEEATMLEKGLLLTPPSSSLLGGLGCAGRSGGPTRVHPSILVLGFLLRWFQDLGAEKEDVIHNYTLLCDDVIEKDPGLDLCPILFHQALQKTS